MELLLAILAKLGLRREKTVEDIISPITKIVDQLNEHHEQSIRRAMERDEEAERLIAEASERRQSAHRARAAAIKMKDFVGA